MSPFTSFCSVAQLLAISPQLLLLLVLVQLDVIVDVTAVTTLVDVVSDVIIIVGVGIGVSVVVVVEFRLSMIAPKKLIGGRGGRGGRGGDMGPLMSSDQGMGEPGGVLGGEYEGRRTVMSFGRGPGFRLFGRELMPTGARFPTSDTERARLRPLEEDEVAPTMSMSASSTIMRLSILNGLPVARDKEIRRYFFSQKGSGKYLWFKTFSRDIGARWTVV